MLFCLLSQPAYRDIFFHKTQSQKVTRHFRNFLCTSYIFSVLSKSFEIYLFPGKSFNQQWKKCTLPTRWLSRYSVIEVAHVLLGGVFSFQSPSFKVCGPCPCQSEDKIFLLCHVTTQLKCHVTLWVDFPHPKPPP